MKFQGLKKESVSSNGLLNQPNSVGILTFPANKVVTSIPDGVIKAGMYGTDAYDVELLEDTTVRGGLFTAPGESGQRDTKRNNNQNTDSQVKSFIRKAGI